MARGFVHASLIDEDKNGYTEYGYRGLEELKQKDEIIAQLKQQVADLQIQLQRMENHANNLQAKASLPRY